MSSKTTLKELVNLLGDDSVKLYHKASDCIYKDDELVIKGDDKHYKVSSVAVAQLTNILGVPSKYIERSPSDLRAFNITYFLMRSDEDLTLSVLGDVISEISVSDDRRSFAQVIKEIASCVGDDVNVIQPDITENYLSMYVYHDGDIANTPLTGMNSGYIFWISMDKNSNVYCSNALIDDIEEVAIEFGNDVPDEVDHTSITDVYNEAASVKNPFAALDNAASRKVKRAAVAADIVRSSFSLNSRPFGMVVEEMELAKVTNVLEAVKACVTAETRVKKTSDFVRLAAFAGNMANYKDPKFCSACHQPIVAA